MDKRLSEIKYNIVTEFDIDAVINILNHSRMELPYRHDITADEINKHILKSPVKDLKKYWLATLDGKAVGYGGSKINPMKPDTGYVDVEIDPNHRNIGIEKEIMKMSLDYLKSKNIKLVHHVVDDAIPWRHQLFSDFGFKDVNHTYSVFLNSENTTYPTNSEIYFEDFAFEEMNNGDIEKIAEIYNGTSSNQSQYKPVSVDMLINLRDCNTEPKNATFAKMDKTPVGACLCVGDTSYRKENDTKTGFVYILGISESHRRKGIGRSLLSHEIEWMRNNGAEVIFGDVDSRNSASLKLCDSIGFKIRSESIAYQLEL